MSRTSLYLTLAVSAILSLGILLGIFTVCTQASQSTEVDICADILKVVDGDTFDAFPVGRVRLADIDAPEIDTPEGKLAKQALLSLVSAYGPRVYLDVDNLYVMDKYNRVVAVVYLRYNSTHVINVNSWLVDNGYASISDYRNEFNPYAWRPYVYLPYDPCLGGVATLTVTMLSTATTTVTSVSTIAQTITTTTIIEKITTYTPPLEVIERTTTVAIEKTVTYTKTAITTTLEKTTTATKIYTDTYTLATTVTVAIVKENWVSIIVVSAIAAVLFALGYTLGRRVSM